VGLAQHDMYVKNVLVNRNEYIHCPIKKNKLPLFKCPNAKKPTMGKQKAADLKSDCNLFSQLFVACQVRQGEFFSHENHSWPPFLSVYGKLRLPNCKSELLSCLSEGISNVPDLPIYDAKVFDGAAVIHSLSKGDAVTFNDYFSQVFIPWTLRELTACPRIDIVWDVYKSDSLKEATRQKRRKGIRRKVSPQTKIPRDFADFLRDSRNKQEQFDLLLEHVGFHEYGCDKEVLITSGKDVISKCKDDPMPISDHEEADTRMCLHVLHALSKGAQNVLVSIRY